MNMTWRPSLLLTVLTAGVLIALLADPVAQDPAYHDFADRRTLLTVPNFLDVFSNLAFVVVGIIGLKTVARCQDLGEASVAWRVFYAGVLLTAFGSGYYHLDPNDETLVWDRLPMTIAFMGFVSIIVGEYLSPRLGSRLLVPLLVVGAGSVFYWGWTESLGRGDLRAYALVQFLPLLLIPGIVLLYRERSELGPIVGGMIVFYIAAKLFEFFDAAVFAAGGVVSGHTLKHLAAAMAPACLLYALRQRRYHAPRT